MLPDTAFVGFVSEDGQKLLLDFPKAFKAYFKRYAGHEVVLTIQKKSEAKTRAQEMGFHAMIQPWAKDEGHQIEALKRDLLGEVFGYLETPSPLTGERVLREPSTAKLSKPKYSQLIEETMVIAARCGYILIAPEEYKRQHPEKYPEYARKLRREKRQTKAA
jgi:hypothetical protein